MSEPKPFEIHQHNGKWWFWSEPLTSVLQPGERLSRLGPFDTEVEANRACDEYIEWLNRMDLGLE